MANSDQSHIRRRATDDEEKSSPPASDEGHPGLGTRDALPPAHSRDDALLTLLGMVSHELRTPLQTMLVNAELIGLTELSHEARGALAALERALDVAMRRLTSITHYVASSGAIGEGVTGTFRPLAIVKEVVGEFATEADQHGQEIRIHWACAEDLAAHGDHVRLHQVLGNFISNAIRHGDGGPIIITGELLAQDGLTSPSLQIAVRNRGPRIPEQARDLIWKPFTRYSPPAPRSKGMGLGLSIVRLLASAEGWQVGLAGPDSSKNDTTTFFVRIPV